MESVNLEDKQQIQKVDRVVLDTKSIIAVQKVSDQVQIALGDLVHLSQKDIVNFLIQERSTELTLTEINKIKNEHFDIVRALKRATQEAIKAKQDGHEIQMDELLKIIQTPSVNKIESSKKSRVRKSKTDATPALTEEINTANDALLTAKPVKNESVQKTTGSKKSENNDTFSDLKSP